MVIRKPLSVTSKTSGVKCKGEFEEKYSFQLKMLTKKEEILLKNRDDEFVKTFESFGYDVAWPDIPLIEMNNSDSSSKFALYHCYQRSMELHHIEEELLAQSEA